MRDAGGNTPLHLAAQENHPHIVNYLLRCKDSGKEAKDELGCTPLHDNRGLVGAVSV